MSDVEGHDITGGTENHTMWLTCSCGTWSTEELYEVGAPLGSPEHLVTVMGRLADAGRDHIVEVVREQEATRLQTRQHAEGCDPAEHLASLRSEEIGHHRLRAMTDDMLRGAYTMTVLLGRDAGNQPPVYRRLQALTAELDRRGIERPVVPS